MMRIVLLLVLLLSMNAGNTQNITRITYIPPSSNNTTTIIDGNSIQGLIPGDTIALQGGKYYQLLIRNIKGTINKPIILINKGAQVIVTGNPNYGIKIGGCAYLKFSGKGNTSNYYGFLINNITTTSVAGGVGLSIDDLSTNIEVENVEINKTTYVGIMAKTDPSCSFLPQYNSFVMRDLIIHDTYIHNIGHEGMYVGSSKFKEGYVLTCNSTNTTVFPHLLKNLKIYRNKVDSTGWDGIQIGCADSCKIYNNNVSRDSQADSLYQMSGILIGGGSQNCLCYNNKILNGHGDALEILGQGNILLFNNLIVNPGQGIKDITQNKHGVFVNTSASSNPGWVYVFNNTIINPKTHGLYFVNNIIPSKASNNIIIVPDPYNFAINYLKNPSLDNSYNLTKNTVYESPNLFNDPSHGDYSLTNLSEAKDKGINLSSFGVVFDILDNTRPYPATGNFDKGAYEYISGVGIKDYQDNVKGISIIPNPNNGEFGIKFSLSKPALLSIKIYNIFGKCVFDSGKQKYVLDENIFRINSHNFPSGLYLVQICGEETQRCIKMIVNR